MYSNKLRCSRSHISRTRWRKLWRWQIVWTNLTISFFYCPLTKQLHHHHPAAMVHQMHQDHKEHQDSVNIWIKSNLRANISHFFVFRLLGGSSGGFNQGQQSSSGGFGGSPSGSYSPPQQSSSGFGKNFLTIFLPHHWRFLYDCLKQLELNVIQIYDKMSVRSFPNLI